MSKSNIPKVNPGDLVLLTHRSGVVSNTTLFVSDGRIARLDDTGYSKEDIEKIVRERNVSSTSPDRDPHIEYGSTVYHVISLIGGGQLSTPYSSGTMPFVKKIVEAGKFRDFVSVFKPRLEIDPQGPYNTKPIPEVEVWDQVLRHSPGIAMGYYPDQGVLDLHPEKMGFRFMGREFKVFNVRNDYLHETQGTFYTCSRDNIEKLVIGANAIADELRGTNFEVYLRNGVIPTK